MMAFVGSFTAPTLSRNAFAGAKVSSVTRNVVARVSMSEKSPSVPFMDVPANLSPDMPGYVGFGKYFQPFPRCYATQCVSVCHLCPMLTCSFLHLSPHRPAQHL